MCAVGEELLCRPHVFAAQFLRTATSNQPHHHWSMPFYVSIIHYLQHEHMLTRAGVLLRDPRAAEPEWQRALEKAGEESGTMVSPLEVEALRELLHVAWGVHEKKGNADVSSPCRVQVFKFSNKVRKTKAIFEAEP